MPATISPITGGWPILRNAAPKTLAIAMTTTSARRKCVKGSLPGRTPLSSSLAPTGGQAARGEREAKGLGERHPESARLVANDRRVAGGWIVVELVDTRHDARSTGVQVDVADELAEVFCLFAEHRLEAVLKEVCGLFSPSALSLSMISVFFFSP